jgi:tetratricopeptide (TPR) repeat protein
VYEEIIVALGELAGRARLAGHLGSLNRNIMNAKPGRNDPCACGSGRKYKKCCGPQNEAQPANAHPPRHPDTRSGPQEAEAPTPAEIERLIAMINGGRDTELEAKALELVDRYPKSGLAWKVLGLSRWRQGRDPLPALENAANYLPDDAEAHSNLGNALRTAGRPQEAVAAHQRALTIAPGYAEAHNNLGSALQDLGRLEEAAASYGRAAELRPSFAMALANLGGALKHLGRPHDAIDSYRRALLRDPTRAEVHCNLGNALLDLGQPEAAAASYQRALEIKPDFVAALVHLGGALRELGQASAAEARFREALQLQPGSAEVHHNLAVVLRLQNLTAQAEASCRTALDLNPRLVAAIVFLAKLQVDRGNFAEAEALFQRAIAIDPDSPEAWSGLPSLRKMTVLDAAWLAEAQRVADRSPAPRREVHLRYAIGKYFDDVRDFPQAFANYRRANELTKLYAPKHDREQLARFVEQLIQWHDRSWVARARNESRASQRPVFIVGMPRSGTTLAEQILASHPAVFGAGELPFWGIALARSLAASDGRNGEIDVRALADDYLRLLDGLSAAAERVVDKMPTNFLSIGLIHAALPDARIIHMRRNPVDTCLSIYFQDFETAYSYANDPGDLAHSYGEYLRVMDHWRSVLHENAILDVPYEGLVEDQEGWSRRMLEFIGLPWDPNCMNFHQTRRTVATVSSWQVRQAINKSSVERWRHYERFVEPLLRLTTLRHGG